MNMHVKLNSTRPKSKRTKPIKPNNPWTDKDDEILRDSLALGYSHASIARNLGRAECAIKTLAQQSGLRMPEGKGRARNWRRSYGLAKVSETGKLRKHYAEIEEIAAQSPAKNPPVPFFD